MNVTHGQGLGHAWAIGAYIMANLSKSNRKLSREPVIFLPRCYGEQSSLGSPLSLQNAETTLSSGNPGHSRGERL